MCECTYTTEIICRVFHKKQLITIQNTLRRDHLERIADGLPNLEEFTMEYNDGDVIDLTAAQEIVDFLQGAKQLKIATFISYKDVGECNKTAEQLKNEWETTDTTENILSFFRGVCRFVRKNSEMGYQNEDLDLDYITVKRIN